MKKSEKHPIDQSVDNARAARLKRRTEPWKVLDGIEMDLGRMQELAGKDLGPRGRRVVQVGIGVLRSQMRTALTDLGNAI